MFTDYPHKAHRFEA